MGSRERTERSELLHIDFRTHLCILYSPSSGLVVPLRGQRLDFSIRTYFDRRVRKKDLSCSRHAEVWSWKLLGDDNHSVS